MGCSASKSKSSPQNENNQGSNHPINGYSKNMPKEDHKRDSRKDSQNSKWKELVDYNNLKEDQIERIDDGLWRDTKNEVAIYNARQVIDS